MSTGIAVPLPMSPYFRAGRQIPNFRPVHRTTMPEATATANITGEGAKARNISMKPPTPARTPCVNSTSGETLTVDASSNVSLSNPALPIFKSLVRELRRDSS